MVLNHVKTSSSRRQPRYPVHPDHSAAQRWQRQGVEEPSRAAVFRLGALARLAQAHVFGDINVLPHPKGEAAHQLPRLGPPEVSPERPVVALLEHLCAQPPPAGMQRRSAAPCLLQYSRQQRTKNVPPFGVQVGQAIGWPSRSTSWQ